MKRVYLFLGAVFLLMNTASLFAYQNEVKIDVWRTSSYEDYCDYEDVDFYLRASQDCYIAVLLVDPDGYANMIYPRPEMPQYRLRHGHRYRLSELMRDDPLYFYGMDGDAFITVIASRAPVYVDRWFIDEFTSFVEYEYGPSITIDLQFGHGFRVAWHKHLLHRGYGVVSVPFMVHHYYHPRRSIYYQSHKPIIHWESRWKYRTPKPVFVKKRDYDRRNQVSNRSKQQYNYDPSSRDRNDRSNKTDWNKRDRTDDKRDNAYSRRDRKDDKRDDSSYKRDGKDDKRDDSYKKRDRKDNKSDSTYKKRDDSRKKSEVINKPKRTPKPETNSERSKKSSTKKKSDGDSDKEKRTRK